MSFPTKPGFYWARNHVIKDFGEVGTAGGWQGTERGWEPVQVYMRDQVGRALAWNLSELCYSADISVAGCGELRTVGEGDWEWGPEIILPEELKEPEPESRDAVR